MMLEAMTEIAKRKATATKPRPKNDAELKRYLMDTFAVTLPDTVVEAGHSTPFRAFSDAYFARSGVAVWKASRGFGGKSFLLSLLGAVEAETLGAEITVLGGSGEQATRVQVGWAFKPIAHLYGDIGINGQSILFPD
jgi:hypothetical protein